MKHRKAGAAVLLVAVSSLAVVLLARGPLAAAPVAPAPVAAVAYTTRILPAVETQWVWTGPNSGGFGETASFAAKPSLYQTAWNLRIAATLGLHPAAIDRAALEERLRRIAEAPDTEPDLPPLQAVHLAVMALHDLDAAASPEAVTRSVASLRDGDAYRPAPAAAPTTGSTVLAIQTLELVGSQAPATVRSALATDLVAASTRPLTSQDLATAFLPELEVARDLLPAPELASLGPAIERQLDRLVADAAGGTGIELSALARASAVARALDLGPLSLHPAFEPLVAPDGGLGLTAHPDLSDPQVTYYGLLLGYAPGPRLVDAIGRTALPGGWLAPPGRATPQSTYLGIVVEHALGSRAFDAPVRASLGAWLGTPPTTDAREASALYYSVALARQLDVVAPASILPWVTAILTGPEARSLSPESAGWLVRLAGELGADLTGVGQRSRPAAVSSMATAFAAWRWSRLLDDGALRAAARSSAGALATADGAFRSSSGVDQIDLRSTVMGCLIEATSCSSPARRFLRDGLAWMNEAGSGTGDASNLYTSYLWVVGAGLSTDWGGVS